jgi:carbon storage regulator CsrA
MLVLSRKKDERVIIRTPEGREIVVTVVECCLKGNKVRLGFSADRDVQIYRDELRARAHEAAGGDVPGD